MAQYARTEFVVPEAEAGKLVWALAEEPGKLDAFEGWETAVAPTTRDILVCTHGTVDAACAKFGFPLYRYLRQNQAANTVRVWRVSHFGGHVFAPTLMDMPTGHFWAYAAEAQADQIVRRTGQTADLRGHYRGWAGLANGFLQAAEREMWLREGWQWFDWPKQGEIMQQDKASTPACAEICVRFQVGEKQCTYQARVEIINHIEMIHTTGYNDTYPYPQYKVTCLERSDNSCVRQ